MGLERWKSKKGRDNKGTVYRIQKERCYRRKSIKTREEEKFCVQSIGWEKKAMVELGSSGMPYRRKSTAE